MFQNKIYTICRGNKTVSVQYKQLHYVIGFKKTIEVRNVMYNMHPEPKFDLIRNADLDLSEKVSEFGFDYNLNIDVGATLFIPKCSGNILDPMNDGGFHMDQHTEDSFLMFPLVKNLGVILPMTLQEENKDEFIYKVLVIDPHRR